MTTHTYRHKDGTTISVSGPQADRATRLIQAAPKMLEVLKEMLKHIDDDMNNRPVCLWQRRESVVDAISEAERVT